MEELQSSTLALLLSSPLLPWPTAGPAGSAGGNDLLPSWVVPKLVHMGKDSYVHLFGAVFGGRSFNDLKKEIKKRPGKLHKDYAAVLLDRKSSHRDILAAVYNFVSGDDGPELLSLPPELAAGLPPAQVMCRTKGHPDLGQWVDAGPGTEGRPSPFSLLSAYFTEIGVEVGAADGVALALVKQFVEKYDELNGESLPDSPSPSPSSSPSPPPSPPPPPPPPPPVSDNEEAARNLLSSIFASSDLPVKVFTSVFPTGAAEKGAGSEFDAMIVDSKTLTLLVVIEMKVSFPTKGDPNQDIGKKVIGLKNAKLQTQPFKSKNDDDGDIAGISFGKGLAVPLVYMANKTNEDTVRSTRMMLNCSKWLKGDFKNRLKFFKVAEGKHKDDDLRGRQPVLCLQLDEVGEQEDGGSLLEPIDVAVEVDPEFPFKGVMKVGDML